MRLPCRVLIPVLALLSPLTALAQYTVANVVFQHAAPYTDAELSTTADLHPGQPLSNDSLTNAAHHLLDTGLFDDAQITLSGQGKARTVVLDLKPIPLDKLLPASYENLVWFTPTELTEGIHKRVPLYRGVASDAGTFPDDIQAALQQMLTEKGISATLSHSVAYPTTVHPVRVVDFSVDKPEIHLGSVHLSFTGPAGSAVALAPFLQQAANQAPHFSYDEGLTGKTIEDVLLAPARNAGYVTAKLDSTQRTIALSGGNITVNFTAHLVSGETYKVSSISWDTTPLYSATDFDRDSTLHPGDLARASALASTEALIANTYLRLGYMDVYLVSTSDLDDKARTISYTLHVVPGQPYYLHTVAATGLSPDAQQVFNTVWKMKPGDPYSDLAVGEFLRRNIAQPAFKEYGAAFRASADPQTHLVDLALTFAGAGTPSN